MSDSSDNAWIASTLSKAWDDYVALNSALRKSLKDSGAMPKPPAFEAWMQMAESMGMRSSDAASTLKPDRLFASLTPGVGLSREYQMIAQRLAAIGARFERCHADFTKQGAKITEQALASMSRQFGSNPQVANSPAALYEAWIETAEAAYAQAAHRDEFAQSLGQLVDLLSAFKLERGKLLDALSRHLDLPSRAEVNTLHRQVRELKAALRTARAAPGRARRRRPRTRTNDE